MTTTIYRTSTGYTYAIETGQPQHAARVGEGETIAEAIANLTATGVQSAGRWPRDRDLLVIAAACAEPLESLDEAVGDGVTLTEALEAEVDVEDVRELGAEAAIAGDWATYGACMVAVHGVTIIDFLPKAQSDAWFEALEGGATPETSLRETKRMIAETRAQALTA